MEQREVNRTAYYDYLRLFAIFAITMVHVAAYCWYYMDVNLPEWFILTGYKCFNRPPVLLFIMISGALFMGREIPVKVLYKKYILRLVIAFIFWNLVYALVLGVQRGISGVIYEFFKVNYHFWFLLVIIGLYICIPLLKLIVKSEKITRYFLVVSFVFAFLIPEIIAVINGFGGETLVKYTGIVGGHIYDMNLNMFIGYPFFFVAGYYLSHTEISRKVRIVIYILGILGAAAGIILTTCHSRMTGDASDLFCNCFMVHEMLEAVAIFVFFKYNINKVGKVGAFLGRISKFTFGSYLVHDLIIRLMFDVLGLSALSFAPIIAVPVLALITQIIGMAFAALLSKIPFVNKYLV